MDYEGACEVASTVCKCHNETVNVWTHMIGSVMMAILAVLILTNFENVKTIALEGWNQFQQEKSKNSALELDNYLQN